MSDSVETADMRGAPEPAFSVTPDCMIGVAGYVNREYGLTGYSIGLVVSNWSGAGVFHVEHGDGSCFYLHSDWDGEVRTAGWDAELRVFTIDDPAPRAVRT